MDAVDRISDLPEPILHHILSFLPTKDVYKTSALSKTFLSYWSSFPVIVLNYNDFNLQPSIDLKEKFKDSIHQSIQRRNIETDLHTFGLKVPVSYHGEKDHRIDGAIDWALRKRVKELDLDLDRHPRWRKPYKLLPIESLNPIVRLSLRGFQLSDDFNDLIRRCSTIERLQIRLCSGLKCFAFSGATIRSIELTHCEGLENVVIKSPSLETFSYNDLSNTSWSWTHEWKNPILKNIDISNCVFLKNLSLAYEDITDEWVEHTIPLLANLQDLKFVRCRSVKNLKISNESLKSVTLLECDQSPKSLEIVGKNLEYLNFNGCPTCKITTPRLVSFISSYDKTPSLDYDYKPYQAKVTLSVRAEDHLPDSYFTTLRDFIGCFTDCKFLTLICSSNEMLVIPNKLRGKTIKPLHGLSIKNLKIVGFSSISTELVDNLLWLFPSLHTLCFASDDIERLVEFKRYRHAIRDRSQRCCSDLHRKCWRHYFKIAMFDNFDTPDGIVLRKYFEQNGKVVRSWK